MFEQRFADSADPVRAVLDGLPATTLPDAYRRVAARVAAAEGLDPDDLVARLLARDAEGSTAFAPGALMPHCTLPGAGASHVLFARPAAPLDHPEHGPIGLLVFLFVRDDGPAVTAAAIARTVRALADDDLVATLLSAPAIGSSR
ncbi:PTS sugar transporter subunit IIA [Propioniciclava coleopterorum]|uniref:PTS sugar transporter subunit IIA n=1 Tax=Propioniciclava coleopterorum TaxID=2714937 RepID=A0A6G7Y2C0_9ACTN|nr:PTS sugar transporter subunit IIA [Propioniciclava coleopterorum]QIK71024.1 PTS sugar transporter subunit IIA [Propioniciclava coleopterorum]